MFGRPRRPSTWRSLVALGWVSAVLQGCSLAGYPAGTPEAAAPVPVSPGDPAPESVRDERDEAGNAPASPVAEGGRPVALTAATAAAFPSDGGRTYEVLGETYHVLDTALGYHEEGLASWYGEAFNGRPTASGETFDMYAESAAHRTLPLHTWVEVENLENGRRLVLKVNDRGPFAHTDQRIIDLSWAAAERLGVVGAGTARVRVRAVEPPG